MPFRVLPAILLGAGIVLSSLSAAGQQQQADVTIGGTISTKPLLDAMVRSLKKPSIAISTTLTSVEAIDGLASGKIGVALITKAISGETRADYPQITLNAIPIGMEVLAVGVSDDVWNAGVHAITMANMKAIYEQKIVNWRDAGGPDEKISLFNFEQGTGIWEFFAEWLYGDNRKAPNPKGEKVTSTSEAENALEFTPGSIATIPAAVADGSRCHALGIQTGTSVARPIPADVASGAYPLTRPLLAVVIGRPNLDIRAVTDFLTGPEGQALIKKTGGFGVEAAPKPTPEADYQGGY